MISKTTTCDGCSRRRKCTRPGATGIRFYWLCTECNPRVKEQSDISKLRKEHGPARRARNAKRSKLAYPVIGGPLDGYSATTDDFHSGQGKPGDSWFREDGMYMHLANEYMEYNGAHGGYRSKRVGGFPPSMIYVHKSLLRPLISGRTR
jgi:hypothetical protein